MKKSLFFILAIALILGGCSKKRVFEGEGARETLLSTIPSASSTVYLINLESVSSSLGTKDDKGQLKISSHVSELLHNLGAQGNNVSDFLTANDAGIIFSSMAFFEYKGEILTTFFVKNTESFVKYCNEKQSLVLKETDGVFTDNYKSVFVKDNQVWLVSATNVVSPLQIKSFLNLNEDNSYLKHNISQQLISDKNALDGICDISNISSFAGTEGTQAASAMALLFDDANYVRLTANFLMGKINADIFFLNKNFKPASLAISLDKLNMQEINAYPATGNCMYALSINPQSFNKVIKPFANMVDLDSSIGLILKVFGGTVIGSGNFDAYQESNVDLMITVDPVYRNELPQLVAEANMDSRGSLKASIKDGSLLLTSGTPLNIEFPASLKNGFQGSYGGLILSKNAFKGDRGFDGSDYVSGFSLLLVPDGEGVDIKIVVDTKKGQNSMITLLELLDAVRSRLLEAKSADFSVGGEEDGGAMENFYNDDDEELIKFVDDAAY